MNCVIMTMFSRNWWMLNAWCSMFDFNQWIVSMKAKQTNKWQVMNKRLNRTEKYKHVCKSIQSIAKTVEILMMCWSSHIHKTFESVLFFYHELAIGNSKCAITLQWHISRQIVLMVLFFFLFKLNPLNVVKNIYVMLAIATA